MALAAFDDNDPFRKRVLAAVFSQSLKGGCTASSLAGELSFSEEKAAELLAALADASLVSADGSGGVSLTERGRGSIKVVLAGGVFDVIHAGHIYTLGRAKALGDALVVSVARDSTVGRVRSRPTINDERVRAAQVGAVKGVDAAILGSERDIFDTVERVRPDVIVIGYDQKHGEDEMKARAKERGVDVTVVRLDTVHPGLKSSSIKDDPRFGGQL
ncbi:MAG: adenylyltransferase/cytidyltransferase family protein [Nitrososphaerota archaeon]|nr:adenylyltransferase/cytidyltransferase family protein [Nitrososphaerota archaeon]